MQPSKMKLVLVSLLCCFGSLACASRLNKEAVEMNQKYWEEHFMKCGDSYYGGGDRGQLHQHRGVTFQVIPSTLTALDEENGYEWRGKGVMWSSSTRNKEPYKTFGGQFGDYSNLVEHKGEWSDWQGGERLETRMDKKKGKWEIYFNSVTGLWNIPKSTCEEILQP